MMNVWTLLLLLLTHMASLAMAEDSFYFDYVIVGAGPSGLQMGYFLKSANRDYVIMERANISGHFFTKYPRHDKLISINKRYTGKINKEYNFRHDWNSLISDDESLLYRHYSKDYFPHRETMLKYLHDYEHKLGLNVKHNTEVMNIHEISVVDQDQTSARFRFNDQHGNIYTCRTLIISTGLSKPFKPEFLGSELMEGYEDISVDPDDFEGQNVFILGKGNSAFEIADRIIGSTNLIHVCGRDRIRLSWATHYVGDIRAVNTALLDAYQLKSQDGVLEVAAQDMNFTKIDGKIYATLVDSPIGEIFDNFAARVPYDRLIRALGFTFDDSLFNNKTHISRFIGVHGPSKFPNMGYDYQSRDVAGLYFTGPLTHSLDFRKSSGGFIHGFRYTARVLHKLLEWKNHHVAWPLVEGPISQLLPTIMKRVNEASAPYQMFGVLCDVVIFNNDHASFGFLEEYPASLLHELPGRTGRVVGEILVIMLQYGPKFSGPNEDVFRNGRANSQPEYGHNSNFLHPVIYYYKTLPTLAAMTRRAETELLPRPDAIHHITEDFHTLWDAPQSHILLVRRFIEKILGQDMRFNFAETCFQMLLLNQTQPHMCNPHYMSGQGLIKTKFM